MPANAVPSVALEAVSPEAARERILDAAVALFAVSGYEGTAVRAIVQRAGTNLNSVNYYFGGKLGLYRAVMQRELARAASFTAHLPKPAAKSAVAVRLEALVLRLLTLFVSTHSQLPRMAALEVVNPSGAFDTAGLDVDGTERRELRELVREVQGVDVDDACVERGVRSVLSQCVYFMFMGDVLQRAGSPVFANAQAVRELASDITVFSLAGLRAQAAQVQKQKTK
jgi:AcrR family transcriptional regulator